MKNEHDPLGKHSEDDLDGFEQSLQARSIGAPADHKGVLMYQCGYAAGIAVSKKRSAKTATRWRVVGVAASMIASLSLVSHFLPFKVRMDDPIGMEVPVQKGPAVVQSNDKNESNSWVMRLTRNQPTGHQRSETLRASEMNLSNFEPELVGTGAEPIGPENLEKPLRPQDFPLFF